MIANCRVHLCHFNRAFVDEKSGQIAIEETDVSGAGTAKFSPSGTCIVLKSHRNAPLVWSFSNRKCADGAFFSFTEQGVELHIVELKSGLNAATWGHVLEQFRGMFLTALATSRLLHIDQMSRITCYIAFTTNKMEPAESASPVLLKSLVGKRNPYNGQVEWETEQVELPFDMKARIVKATRDSSGNADFGAV